MTDMAVEFEFELFFALANEDLEPADYEEALGQAGLTDTVLGLGRKGHLALGVIRKAKNYAEAVDSAISGVMNAIPDAQLLVVNSSSIEPLYLIYDLECSFSDSNDAPADFRELLELGVVVVDKDYEVVDTFQSHIKPKLHPLLSSNCLELLGDIQPLVDVADELPGAWLRFEQWLLRYPVCRAASWGISDQTFLQAQLERYQLQSDFFEIKYVDLKKAFRKSRPIKIKPVGLRKACEILQINMGGKHHSALDDALNALSVAKKLDLLGGNDG